MKLNLRKGIYKADWKPIKDYEDIYIVSNLGQIRRIKKLKVRIKAKKGTTKKYKTVIQKGKILKPSKGHHGHKRVTLSKNGNSKRCMVHRLVAETFIDNIENKTEVDHITPIANGGKDRVWNLRWCNHNENMNNPLSIKNHRRKAILCIETNEVYINAKDAEKYTNIKYSDIVKCCRKQYNSADGLHWTFVFINFKRG